MSFLTIKINHIAFRKYFCFFLKYLLSNIGNLLFLIKYFALIFIHKFQNLYHYSLLNFILTIIFKMNNNYLFNISNLSNNFRYNSIDFIMIDDYLYTLNHLKDLLIDIIILKINNSYISIFIMHDIIIIKYYFFRFRIFYWILLWLIS